ncbi:AAA family ATPase [Enterocloster bolteae]|uniref:AAA family ATPase n=1 Tax=Enterocloster bolteae TaxID=208479 RepID=UPI00205A781D|nr:MAG TPA: AAA domain protein [Caudoviricetes sp.]
MGNFQEVVRAKSKLRMALTGVSGAGKTLGALYIAYGLTGDWSRIAVIDTEHERARMYANRMDLGTGKFLYCPLYPPYTAERYTSLVKEAASLVGPDGAVIVDSFSHAWNNEGGVLDVKDRIAAQAGKNSYTAWNEAGKVQNSLVNTILAVGCHTIVTMRSKMDYVMQENERGKTQPVKVGLAPVQRDDTEYEFDIVLDIARSHIATASKDVTFLDKFGEIITPELGRQLKAWLDDGVDPAQLQGEKPITKEQWTELSKPYRELPETLQAAYKAFGYNNPSEIRQKDIEPIKAKAAEYVAAGGAPYA